MNSTFALNVDVAKKISEITDQYKTGLDRELQRAQDCLVRELLERLSELDAKRVEVVLNACFFASLETDLVGFGAKIKPLSDKSPEKILVREPFQNSREIERSLSEFGGTRHQSAAQFVFDQPKAFAIVVSQDGKISVVFWNAKKGMVSALSHAEYLFVDAVN